MQSLQAIDGFGANHVGAALLDDSGVVATHGELDAVFALASLTKLFTTYAVLIACEEQLLSLDDPAGPPGSTVAHLLSHASGMHPTDASQVLAAPGARRIYSSASFEVLGDLLADRAAMSFDEYVQLGVFDPLGMTRSSAAGSPGHGAHASVDDLCRFTNELFHPTLINQSTLARATHVVFPGLDGVLPGFGRQDPCDWGLGFEVRGHKTPHWTGGANSPQTYGHFGQFGSCIWIDPIRRAALIACSDRQFGPWAVRAWPMLADAAIADLDAAPDSDGPTTLDDRDDHD